MKTKTKKYIIKKIFIIVISVVLAGNGQNVFASEITSGKMIELANQSRAEADLGALIINEKLSAAAEAKVNDMFQFQYFDHNSPTGVTPWHWISSSGYKYSYAGENLAIDFVTAEGSHNALMQSIAHRKNILSLNYSEIGVAVKKDLFNGTESIIIVEEFGAPYFQNEAVDYVPEIKEIKETTTAVKSLETQGVEEKNISLPKIEQDDISLAVVNNELTEKEKDEKDNEHLEKNSILEKENQCKISKEKIALLGLYEDNFFGEVNAKSKETKNYKNEKIAGASDTPIKRDLANFDLYVCALTALSVFRFLFIDFYQRFGFIVN